MSRILSLVICILCTSCYDRNLEQYTLHDGNYQSSDSIFVATLALGLKVLVLSTGSNPIDKDTIKIGRNFTVKGCPTNISYSCEIQCYKLDIETLKIGQREIINPAIGPMGEDAIIICSEPMDKISGGSGLSPEGGTTEFIELLRN
jgi:hypothetical protein